MDNQNPVNNNPPFEEFLENLHSLTDEELQSIYGGGITVKADLPGVDIDADVDPELVEQWEAGASFAI